MAEAEILEVSTMMWGNSISLMGLLITLISGYLIVAYITGKGLTYSQALIVNILYVGFAAFLVLSMFAFFQTAGELEELAFEMSTTRKVTPRPLLAYLVGGFGSICVAASLKFMWDIRH